MRIGQSKLKLLKIMHVFEEVQNYRTKKIFK